MLEGNVFEGNIVERAMQLLGHDEVVGRLAKGSHDDWVYGTIDGFDINPTFGAKTLHELATMILDLKNEEDLKKIRAAGW